MRFIFFLSILTPIFTTGKAIECYSCIIGTPEKNRTSLSSAVKIFAETFPNEFCNKSMDINEYPTCRTQRNCIKSVVEDSQGETVIHLCQGNTDSLHLKPYEPKIFKHSLFKISMYPCNTVLCNGASEIVKSSAMISYLPFMLILFI